MEGIVSNSDQKIGESIFDIINNYGTMPINSIVINGAIWFCGKDIAQILEYRNTEKALSQHVKSRNKATFEALCYPYKTHCQPIHMSKLKKIYINEPGLYSLIMRSKQKAAEQFQDWVTDELLPTLRKKGSYKMERNYIERTRALEKELAKKDAEIARIEKQRLALSSYVRNMERLEKNQIFYLVTSAAYSAQSRFEFGGVKDTKELKGRLNAYNTGRAEGDLYYYVKIEKCNSYKCIEERFHIILKNFKDKPGARKEMVHLRYDLLAEITELICENSDREVDFINEKCQKFLDETVYSDPVIPAPLDLGNFIEITHSRNGERAEKRIDVTGWSDEQIRAKIEEIVELCARNTKNVQYNLQTQKDTLNLELPWVEIAAHMKQLKGMSMTEWRAKVRDWYQKVKPTKLVIKGLRVKNS